MNIRERVGHQFRDLQGADLDLLAYITAIVVGAILVAISKAIDAPTFILILIPILIIGGYIAACFLIPRLELDAISLETTFIISDSFLLASLTTTLIRFSENPSNSEIISNFGLALVATIVGIVGRTVLNQMRKDPLAIEKESALNWLKHLTS